MRMKGKVAIVTGAGSRAEGIGNGRAAATLLAREGASVALLDTVAEWAAETRALIAAEGGSALVIPCDVTDEAAAAAAVRRTVEEWGRLDVLVNNVGIGGPPGTAVDVDIAVADLHRFAGQTDNAFDERLGGVDRAAKDGHFPAPRAAPVKDKLVDQHLIAPADRHAFEYPNGRCVPTGAARGRRGTACGDAMSALFSRYLLPSFPRPRRLVTSR